jgi:D-alanine-D-alanine ligase-like ATP-grasp enzyme
MEAYLNHYYNIEIAHGSQPNPNCFQLFGVDILIDDDLKAWLIEINPFPSLTFTTERPVEVKEEEGG